MARREPDDGNRQRRGGSGAALAVLLALVVIAAIAPALSPHDPSQVRTAHILEPPSLTFPAGTDHLGRCVLSRTLHGARWSLGGALVVTAIVLVVGTAIGLGAGLGGTVADVLVMRAVDTVLAVPTLLLALAIIGVLGPGFVHVLAAFAAVWWARYARLVRSLVVSLREQDFILASRSAGAGWWHLATRQLVPELSGALLVVAAVEFGEVLLVLSAINFLGLGVTPPTPEWGSMLNDARAYVLTAPRLVLAPGAAIAIVVMVVNLRSDAVRDALDVRSGHHAGASTRPPLLGARGPDGGLTQ